MKRKMSLAVLLAVVCGFVLAGCDQGSTSNPPPPSTNMPGTNMPAPPAK